MNMRRILSLFLAVGLGSVQPAAAQMAQDSSGFPALPPSRTCTPADVPGVWRMANVYESPVGLEVSAFRTNPVQYIWFRPDTIYYKFAGQKNLPLPTIGGIMKKGAKGTQQYVVNESGIIYFYVNSAAIDTQACFIVANATGSFKVKQMLLMPPEGQIKGRLVKVYTKIK